MPKRSTDKISVRYDFEGDEMTMFETVRDHYNLKVNQDLLTFLVKQEYDRISRRSRFEFIRLHDGAVKILDRELERGRGRIVTVQLRGEGPRCELDKTGECVHADYALEIPEAVAIMQKEGLKVSTAVSKKPV